MPVDISKEHAIETYKSLMQFGIEAIKFVLLANGGAAVAILAFLGNLQGRQITVPNMGWPMGFFLSGVFSGGLANIMAYITQLILYQEFIDPEKYKKNTHRCYLKLAVISVSMGVICFIIGAVLAVIRY